MNSAFEPTHLHGACRRGLFFNVADLDKQVVIDVFQDENSDLNPYYPRFKSHQLDIEDTGINLKVVIM